MTTTVALDIELTADVLALIADRAAAGGRVQPPRPRRRRRPRRYRHQPAPASGRAAAASPCRPGAR